MPDSELNFIIEISISACKQIYELFFLLFLKFLGINKLIFVFLHLALIIQLYHCVLLLVPSYTYTMFIRSSQQIETFLRSREKIYLCIYMNVWQNHKYFVWDCLKINTLGTIVCYKLLLAIDCKYSEDATIQTKQT